MSSGTNPVNPVGVPPVVEAAYRFGPRRSGAASGDEGEAAPPSVEAVKDDSALPESPVIRADGLLARFIDFELDRETKDLRILVVDRHTRDVVRQIPPEAVEAFSLRYREFLGLFVDTEA